MELPRWHMWVSAGVHVLLILLVWLSQAIAREPILFDTFQIELVSPPPAAVTEAESDPEPAAPEELVIDTPEPEVLEPEETPPPPEEDAPPDPEPDPTPTEPERDPEPDPEPSDTPIASEEPAEENEESGEDINVRIEGLRRDYPAYYDNIIRQINRCWRWNGPGTLETLIYFVIHRDGTVSDVRTVTSSGNVSFDIEGEGAVECAGRPNRFGPLPDELAGDRLPFLFTIESIRGTPDDNSTAPRD